MPLSPAQEKGSHATGGQPTRMRARTPKKRRVQTHRLQLMGTPSTMSKGHSRWVMSLLIDCPVPSSIIELHRYIFAHGR